MKHVNTKVFIEAHTRPTASLVVERLWSNRLWGLVAKPTEAMFGNLEFFNFYNGFRGQHLEATAKTRKNHQQPGKTTQTTVKPKKPRHHHLLKINFWWLLLVFTVVSSSWPPKPRYKPRKTTKNWFSGIIWKWWFFVVFVFTVCFSFFFHNGFGGQEREIFVKKLRKPPKMISRDKATVNIMKNHQQLVFRVNLKMVMFLVFLVFMVVLLGLFLVFWCCCLPWLSWSKARNRCKNQEKPPKLTSRDILKMVIFSVFAVVLVVRSSKQV